MRRHARFLPPFPFLVMLGAACFSSAKHAERPWPGVCPAIDGLADQLTPGSTLVFGEIHGTQESPRFVGDVACHASAQAPVTVGLEIPRDEQPHVDAFLASAGAPADTEALLAGAFWHRTDQDGRSSQAMLALLGRLREARAAGVDVVVLAFDIASTTQPNARDREMASAIVEARRGSPGRTFVILAGSFHSRRTLGAPWDPTVAWMTKLVVDAGVALATFEVEHAGGSAWVCMAKDQTPEQVCKARELAARPGVGGRPWRIERAADVLGHDGRYGVGATHASPPAIPTP